jgi:hypothetical protein
MIKGLGVGKHENAEKVGVNLNKISDPFFHITRYTYKKIQQEIPTINLNRMLWDRDIYLNHKDDLIELKKFNNGTLFELLYKGYRLFFISEYQKEPYRNNVFWVNILNQGTLYDKYKNEDIITYKFGDFQKGNQIIVNDKRYIAVHTGNSFNRYCQIKNINFSNPTSERSYWTEVSASLNGQNYELEFVTSVFGDYMIVHSVKENSRTLN